MHVRKKMTMKSIILFVVAMMVLLTACQTNSENSVNNSASTSNQSPTSTSSPGEKKQPTEISFWYAWGDAIGKAQEELVKQFNASQDEVVVKPYFHGDYADLQTKLQAAIVAKNAPEVAFLENASVGAFASKGVLEDLTALLERDKVDVKDFIPGVLGNSYADGRFYAFPQMSTTVIMYLNATMLKEAGLDPKGPKTWDELEQYAHKLTIPGKRQGMSMPLSAQQYEMLLAQAGGQLFAPDGKSAGFNTAEGAAPFALWKRMYQEGIIDYPYGENMQELSRQSFIQQKSGMYIFGTARITYFTEEAKKAGFELAGALLPGNKNQNSIANGGNLVMLKGLSDEKKEAAWKFMKWLTDTKQAVYFSSQTGALPIRYSAKKSDELQALVKQNPVFQTAYEQMEHMASRPMLPAYPEVLGIIGDSLEKVMLDKTVTPEQAVKEAADRANKILNK